MGKMKNNDSVSEEKSMFARISARMIIGDHRWLTVFLLLIGLLTIHPAVQGYNDGSRMAAIQSLVWAFAVWRWLGTEEAAHLD